MNEPWVWKDYNRSRTLRANLVRVLQPVNEGLQAVNEMSRSVGYYPFVANWPFSTAYKILFRNACVRGCFGWLKIWSGGPSSTISP